VGGKKFQLAKDRNPISDTKELWKNYIVITEKLSEEF